jgi:hypothetical protein
MIDRVKDCYEQGMSYSQIAEALGISKGRVAGIIHRLGIAKKDQRRCFNRCGSGKRVIVVFEPEYNLVPEVPVTTSPYYSPKQRAAYEDLRQAVENTK